MGSSLVHNNKYSGRRESEVGGQPVFVEDETGRHPLDPRHDLRNHSPDGFQWGYGGSGPAQLALAILAREFNDEVAMTHYQDFKSEYVANWDDEWSIDSKQLEAWMNTQ